MIADWCIIKSAINSGMLNSITIIIIGTKLIGNTFRNLTFNNHHTIVNLRAIQDNYIQICYKKILITMLTKGYTEKLK